VVVTGHEVSALLDHARHRDRPLVLDLHNVLSEVMRGGEELSVGHRARELLHRRAIAAAEAVDASLMAAPDQLWCCGEVDAGEFRSRFPGCDVVAIPNGVDVPSYGPADPAPAPRVVFTASFRYLPNCLAAHELLDALEQLPDVELDLVGTDVPDDLRARIDATPRAHATGAVADVRPHLRRAWVAAMPLRAGSGTRLKVAEAAASGVPIVATAKAVEGIPMEPGVHYRRAEAPEEVVAAIRELVDDERERTRLRAAALDFAHRELSWEAAGRVTRAAVERLVGAVAP